MTSGDPEHPAGGRPTAGRPSGPRSGVSTARLLVTGSVGAAAATFSVLLLLVTTAWPPLLGFDERVVAALNELVSDRPAVVTVLAFVTDLGGVEASVVLLPTAVAWLLVRRLPLLAGYVTATGLGALVLADGTKALVDRVRPVVAEPVAQAHDPSFPSGHALGSTVTYGVLLLLLLPVVPRRSRGWLVGTVVLLVAAVGVTRVALGVHFPSDVLGGWSLGVVWLAVSATAFRRARPKGGREADLAALGLETTHRPARRPVPAADRVLPDGSSSAAMLVAAAVLLWGALVGLGLLVTGPLAPWLRPLDHGVTEWLAEHRTAAWNGFAVAVGHLGGTQGVVVVTVVAAALAVAVTRRRTPVVFLVLLAVVETLLYLGAAEVVDRTRPSVVHLTADLPPTASFPSGHVAATVVTYGGIAVLVRAWGGPRAGRLAAVAAVLAVALVAFSRVYRGVHHPTDVLASLLYAGAWLAVCTAVLRPGRGAPGARPRGSPGPTDPAPARPPEKWRPG